MPPRHEDPVILLREEIRQAGMDLSSLRWASGCLLGFPAFFIALTLVLVLAVGVKSLDLTAAGLLELATSALAVPLALGCGTAIAAGARRLRRARLRARLIALPESQRARVLLPLRREGGDVTRLVEPLIRELRVQPNELSPAGSPEGRGDEPSPVSGT
jgi:hypothetical protein